MDYRRVINIVVLVFLLQHGLAIASDGSQRLKRWVFGSEANVATNHSSHAGLDKASRACMQCHDGSIAGHVANNASRSTNRFGSLLATSHPVGMDYDRSVQNKPHEYKRAASLDPNITLVDGKVSCISCHEIKQDSAQGRSTNLVSYSAKTACNSTPQLTIENKYSKLCLSCHAM